jgi:hypothetical protein
MLKQVRGEYVMSRASLFESYKTEKLNLTADRDVQQHKKSDENA